ncbi:MAG: hypothetical protein Q9227_009332 [Pyrenula ochraceoflavens]
MSAQNLQHSNDNDVTMNCAPNCLPTPTTKHQIPTPVSSGCEESNATSEPLKSMPSMKKLKISADNNSKDEVLGPRQHRPDKRHGMFLEGVHFQNPLPPSPEGQQPSSTPAHLRTPSPTKSVQIPFRPSPKSSPERKPKRKADHELHRTDSKEDTTSSPTIDESRPALVNYYSALPASYAAASDKADGSLPFNTTQPSDTVDFSKAFFSTQCQAPSQHFRLPPKPIAPRVSFTSTLLPPPQYVYKRTNDCTFNIFANGILLFPDLCFALANNLPPRLLFTLYSMSKPFHTICNTRFTTMIVSQARRLCEYAATCFPFRCYQSLCRPDPAPRIPHPNPEMRAAGRIRMVPSFRWLFFLIHRVKVMQEIYALMAEAGTPLPSGCQKVLCKLWFLMDLPDNARRIGVIHSREMWTDDDLYWATFFFLKLDMRFNHPTMRLNGASLARELLLTQKGGLKMLWEVLKRKICKNEYEVVKFFVKTFHIPRNAEEAKLNLFNIPARELGRTQYEYWGRKTPVHPKNGKMMKPIRLMRPDELVRAELVRRKLRLGLRTYLKMLTWGYVDPATQQDLNSRPGRGRRVPGEGWEDVYDDDDKVAGAQVGDDELLDLGDKLEDVSIGVKKDQRPEVDIRRDKEDEEYLQAIMKASEEDPMAEEFADVEEDTETDEGSIAIEDLLAEQDFLMEVDLMAEETLMPGQALDTEDDPVAEEDFMVDEDFMAEEDSTSEEDSMSE